jgi:NADPH2:quinone reductase
MGGLYPVALPFTLGEEAAGVVVDVHSSVTDVKVGQHVAAYQSGCYAEYIVAKADKVAVSLPSLL